MMAQSAQTTMRSQETASGESDRSVLAIRWGGPGTRGTLSLLTDERVPQHLLHLHAGGLAPGGEPRLVEQLCLHDWFVNVREPDLLVRRLLALHGHGPLLRRSFLPDHIRDRQAGTARASTGPLPAPSTPEAHRALRDRELARLNEALRAHNGSVARAAAAVGISRQQAYRLMEAAGVVGATVNDADDLSQGSEQEQ